MIKQKIFSVLISTAIVSIVSAQVDSDSKNAGNVNDSNLVLSEPPINEQFLDVPQVGVGKCQNLVVVPAKFAPRTEQVVVKEAAKTIEIIPAEYEWVEEQVMVKPAGEELKVIPATYRTVTKEIAVEPKTVEKVVVPPSYNEVNEEVVSRPAYLAAKTQGPARTFQTTGEALRLIEIPAQNEIVKKQVVQEPVSVENKPIEAKFVTIEVQEVDQPARVEKVPFEAEYKTVKVKKLVKEAQEVEKEIPAEYKEVKVFDKISEAQIKWEEVLCSDESNIDQIKAVQRALRAQGYNVGTIDGTLGPSTMRAVEKFQREKNLSTGGITIETLRALGVGN